MSYTLLEVRNGSSSRFYLNGTRISRAQATECKRGRIDTFRTQTRGNQVRQYCEVYTQGL